MCNNYTSNKCDRKSEHAENPDKPAPNKERKKPGRKSKKRGDFPLGDVPGLMEPKLPANLERFRVTGNNGAPVAAAAAPAVQDANGSALQIVNLLKQLFQQSQQPQVAVAPAGQAVVNHVSAAAVANKINDEVDAEREINFLKAVMKEEQKRGYAPPAHLADEAFVQATAREYGPAHAPWRGSEARNRKPLPSRLLLLSPRRPPRSSP